MVYLMVARGASLPRGRYPRTRALNVKANLPGSNNTYPTLRPFNVSLNPQFKEKDMMYSTNYSNKNKHASENENERVNVQG